MKYLLKCCLFFIAFHFSSACEDSVNLPAPSPDTGDAGPKIDLIDTQDMNAVDPCLDCRDDQQCVDQACICAAGTTEKDNVCVTDTVCGPNSCNGQGRCEIEEDLVTCFCTSGWTGQFCDACDTEAGSFPDGEGGCTDDLCSLVECGDRACEVQNGSAICVCPAGTQEIDGACREDETCSPTTCNGHGTCDDTNGSPSCTCETGWTDANCNSCDAAAGYHDDGNGGCTNDPCLPNLCTDPNQNQCVATGNTYACECNPGYHFDNGICVEDETCAPSSCNMHGVCDDTTGKTECACEPGYSGSACAECDTASGYHDDGTGLCTTDICLPNPCDQIPNKGVCDSVGNGTMCSCNPGFHDDGNGGCSDDPCLPDPCAATNQACRVVANLAECYVPVCDDGNECTDDTLVGGVCQFVNVAENTPCSTDVCMTGGQCNSGVCSNEVALVCDDGNACTDDTCDPNSGCAFTNNDNNIPDDGIGCSDDSCQAGFASHTNNDANCDDNLFCNGEETCNPNGGSADVNGCVQDQVPVAPSNPSSCLTYGACDEATDDFPLNIAPVNAACNDGIACTINDKCDASGNCAGNITQCGPSGNTCQSTTPFTNQIEISTTIITMDISVDGVALDQIPRVYSNDDHEIFAIDTTTGAWVRLARWDWYNPTLDLDVDTHMLSGVYDIYFAHGTSRTDLNGFMSGGPVPQGLLLLESSVIIGQGTHDFVLDIPTANFTMNISVDGVALDQIPRVYSNDDHEIFAIDTTTGAWVRLARWDWYNPTLDLDVDTHMLSGVYDIYFAHGTSRTDLNGFMSGGPVPQGLVLLESNITVSGTHAFNLDIPTSEFTMNISVDGVALDQIPRVYSNDDHEIFAIDTTTGAWVRLARWDWYNPTLDLDVDTHMLSGVYDIYFAHGTSRTDLNGFMSGGPVPQGLVLLESNITVSGTHAFNLDIPTSDFTMNISVDGVALDQIPRVYSNDDHEIFAIDTTTGAWVRLARWDWYNPTLNLDVDTHMLSGVYDIYFAHGTSRTDLNGFMSGGPVPQGLVLLESSITVSGTHAFNLDIPTSDFTMNISVDGVALDQIPRVYSNDDHEIFAIDTTTRAWVRLARWDWYNPTLNLDVDTHMLSGVYDIYFAHGTSRTDLNGFMSGGPIPQGLLLLESNITVSGTHAFNLNIPISNLTMDISVDGVALDQIPRVYSNDDHEVFAINNITGAWVRLARWDWYNPTLNLEMDTEILSGVYTIYFAHGTSRTDLNGFMSGGPIPQGLIELQQCVIF